MGWARTPVDWIAGDTAYVSVVFTWQLAQAWQRAAWLHSAGYRVKVGGPGVALKTEIRTAIASFAEVGGDFPEAVTRHNPDATFASRGCPVGCYFCIVPKMEGLDFTLLPDFEPRSILCDNNLSALPADYQDYIVDRYQSAGIRLTDANSGFEPRTFDEEVFDRWEPINKGPWRFALDDQGDLPHVIRVLDMLKDRVRSPSRKRVYVLIGNEPFDSCMERIQLVIDRGGDPHVQPIMKLNALTKTPWVRYDWTTQLLKDVARWCNRHVWRKTPFVEYQRFYKGA